MRNRKDHKKHGTSFDGVWTDDKESLLNRIILKLRQWEEEMSVTPDRFGSRTRDLIVQVAAVCVRMKDERRYAELVAIQMDLERQIVEFISAKLSEGRLTKREFSRYSKILRGIEDQVQRRLPNFCNAGSARS